MVKKNYAKYSEEVKTMMKKTWKDEFLVDKTPFPCSGGWSLLGPLWD